MRTQIPAARQRGCPRWGPRGLPVALACAALLAALAPLQSTADELETRAKFLYQLTRYVKWPEAAHASPSAPLVVGIVDDPLLAHTMVTVVAGRQVRGRNLEVVPITEPETADVHLLFLASGGRSALRRLAHRFQDGNVLTVAEEFDFPELGGDVGIELIGGRISFSVNRRKVNRGDFSISSKLMRLASEVK